MKNIRLPINGKLWRSLSDPLWFSILDSVGDPAWECSSRSTWSYVSNTVCNSGAGLPVRVVNIIKYRS